MHRYQVLPTSSHRICPQTANLTSSSHKQVSTDSKLYFAFLAHFQEKKWLKQFRFVFWSVCLFALPSAKMIVLFVCLFVCVAINHISPKMHAFICGHFSLFFCVPIAKLLAFSAFMQIILCDWFFLLIFIEKRDVLVMWDNQFCESKFITSCVVVCVNWRCFHHGWHRNACNRHNFVKLWQ